MNRILPSFLLIVQLFTISKGEISIIEATDASFKVAYNDVLIIDHYTSDDLPDAENHLMRVGIGSFDGSEHIGNWILNDTEVSNIGLKDIFGQGGCGFI